MTTERKKKQWAVAALLGVGIFGVLVFMGWILNSSNQEPLVGTPQPTSLDIDIVSDRLSSAAPEQSWIANSRIEIDRLASLVDHLERSIEGERAMFSSMLSEQDEKYADLFTQQALRLADLEADASGQGATSQSLNQDAGQYLPETIDPLNPDFSATGSEFIQRRTRNGDERPSSDTELSNAVDVDTTGFGTTFVLSDVSATQTPFNNVRNYLPPGSYAPAVVLSGADAATNVANREDPVPVLFRVTGDAVTAAAGGGNGHRVPIEGCVVQGSAIGDLSSERVRVRLLSMTCTNRSGRVWSSNITGYMVGAGKAGVRGQVVSREGNLVTNAAIAGALGGLAGATGNIGTTEDANISELVQSAGRSAAAGGVGQAASSLSEYYINRAEQYQPVITLNGGSQVELVFMEGVSLQ